MSVFRRTKVIATIGPSSSSPEMVIKLIEAGVNVLRINMSHASHDEFRARIRMVRDAEKNCASAVGVIADLQGPKLRIGQLEGHKPVVLKAGSPFEITTEALMGNVQRVSTTYEPLPKDVKTGDRILLDDGRIELRVTGTTQTTVSTVVVNGGELGENKGMNLPGVAVSSPSLTEKDREDVAVVVAGGADFVALSFVRRAQDVLDAKAAVKAAGATHLSSPRLRSLRRSTISKKSSMLQTRSWLHAAISASRCRPSSCRRSRSRSSPARERI